MQRHRNYLLKVLFVIQVFNAMDGWALGLVMQDIKLDLSLSDTQLGIMTGFAFALMYALAGLSIARWADRGDRVAIVSVTAAIWSVLVTACGTARNFLQLLLLRIGVGVGEAGCVPASQSLIADYFDRGERPRANALYMMGTGVSALIGYGLAGWLNELYGWRTMFMILGLPGLIVAALAWLTLREPRFQNPEEEPGTRFVLASRSLFKTTAKASAPPPRLWSVAVTLWSNKTVRHLLLFWAVSGFFTTAMWQWQPMFFVRSHGLNTGELGLWFAAVYGLGGMSGAFLGGACASRYANSNERLQLEVGAWICCALVLVSALIYWVPDSHLAFGLLALYTVMLNAFSGPFWALNQTLIPQNMRAAATAIFALLGTLIGNGLGSLATGAMSDAFQRRFGTESLRYALLVMSPGFLWAAWHLWRASRSVTRDLATTHVQDEKGVIPMPPVARQPSAY